jgi:hypothetical protein
VSVRTGTGDLSKIEPFPEAFMDVEEVAKILNAHPQSIREQARNNPVALGFPVCVCGTRVRIPREGFWFWMRYGAPKV